MRKYDRPAYSLEDYKELRAINRKAFALNPMGYIMSQRDWEDIFTISVKGKVYVMSNFVKGVKHLRNHYGCTIPISDENFDRIFASRHNLPTEIDYIVRGLHGYHHSVVDYISHNYCFRHVFYNDPEQKEVRKVFYPVIQAGKGVPKTVQKDIIDIINRGYSE